MKKNPFLFHYFFTLSLEYGSFRRVLYSAADFMNYIFAIPPFLRSNTRSLRH